MGPDITGLHGVVISPTMVALNESWLSQDVHAWPRPIGRSAVLL